MVYHHVATAQADDSLSTCVHWTILSSRATCYDPVTATWPDTSFKILGAKFLRPLKTNSQTINALNRCIYRTTAIARIPTPQSASQTSVKLRTSSKYPPVFFEHLRSIHMEACLWFSWLGEVQLSSCLYAQAKTWFCILTKILVALCIVQGAKEPSNKEKSETKNGFNFGYTFWRQFKYRQEGREAKTEAKNGFEKPSLFPPPWAMEHEDSTQFANGKSSHQLQPTSASRTNSAAAISGQKFLPKPTGHKTWDCRVRTEGPWTGLCFHGTLR